MIRHCGHAGAALLCVLLVFDTAQADASLAWNGIVSHAGFTEISLSTSGLPDGRLTVTAPGSPPVVHVVPAGAARPSLIILPVAASVPGALVLTVEVEGQAPVELAAGELRIGPPPVVAVGQQAIIQLAGRRDLVALSPAALPRTKAAYSHIAAIVLGADALEVLDDRQLETLLAHIGDCGATLLTGVQTDTFGIAAGAAGCEGRFLRNAEHGAATELNSLLEQQARPLPAAATLDAFLERGGETTLVAAFLSGTLLIALLLTLVAGTRLLSPLVCLLAAALTGVLWSTGGRQQSVAWGEVVGDGAVARFSALAIATAPRRGDHRLSFGGFMQEPLSIAGSGVTVHWSSAPERRDIAWSTAALQRLHVYSSGRFPVAADLRAVTEEDGVVVCNKGAEAAPPAWLHFGGRTWQVPSLAPNTDWSTSAAPPLQNRSVALALLQERTPADAAGLLLRSEAFGADAWLVRIEAAAHEDRPCLG